MEAISITKQQVKNIEIIDQLHTKLYQLHAMTTAIYGEGFKSFEGLSDELKENYLWACADITKEALDLSKRL